MSITTIAIYAFLLLAMLIGLLRYRGARSFRLWYMLVQQVERANTVMILQARTDRWPNHLGMDMVCFSSGS